MKTLLNTINFKDTFSVTLILFSVIDISGSIPFIIDLKRKYQIIESGKITLLSGILLFAFLFIGESILTLFGVDVQSFAVAGGLIMFLLGLEMVLDISLFKHDIHQTSHSPIVPLVFPLIAGAGSMTTLISLNAEYAKINIILGILSNLMIVYLVLRSSEIIDKKLGVTGALILRKFFGTILLAMAIRLIKQNVISI
ncbi:MAG: MarC family protein [Bacteriovorax sp.]|nr:MarC family protein [Bacteriovorax sp.]